MLIIGSCAFANVQEVKAEEPSFTATTGYADEILIRGLSYGGDGFLAGINGLFIGPIQSASRVVVTSILNKNNQGKGFGLFATSGKLTSFLGPLLVSTVTFLTESQRIGFSAAIILLLIGLIILLQIKKIN